MMRLEDHELKAEITHFLKLQGADVVGVAAVDRWEEEKEKHFFYSPTQVWPPARAAVVAGMGMPLPVVETTPSSYHMELYRSCNRLLDEMALKTVNYLLKHRTAASFFPRDGFGSVKLLKENPHAAFDHRFSAYYAGLGNLGWNNSLLTPEFGPRIRFVTVFLDRPISGSDPMQKPLCIQCGLCVELCPPGALKKEKGGGVSFEMEPCRKWHEQLTSERRYPCGICIKVCPVGEDRAIYGAEKRNRLYIEENQAMERGMADQNPLYRSWKHARSFGSWK